MDDGLLERDDSFAADLKRQRTERNMTQQELGEKISRSAKCIADFEAGVTRPRWDTIHTLNDVLNGRSALGMKIVDLPEGACSMFFRLEDVADDLLEAERERRRRAHTVSD